MLHQNMAIRRKRFQPWPFYRRTHFDAEMQAEVEELWRKMEEGYDPREDPGSPLYRGNVRSCSSTLAGPNYGSTRYGLRETPDYLRSRDGTAERGCDLEDLDFIVAKLLRGERLARGYRPRKLRGPRKGLMECRIGGSNSDWSLVYRYEDGELVLHGLYESSCREYGTDRSLPASVLLPFWTQAPQHANTGIRSQYHEAQGTAAGMAVAEEMVDCVRGPDI